MDTDHSQSHSVHAPARTSVRKRTEHASLVLLSNTLQTGLLVGSFTLVGGFLATLCLRWLDDHKAKRLLKQQLDGAVTTVMQEMTMNAVVLRSAIKAFDATYQGRPMLSQLSLSDSAYERVALLLAQQLPEIAETVGFAYHLLRTTDLLSHHHRLIEHGRATPDASTSEAGEGAPLHFALDELFKAEAALRAWAKGAKAL